MMSLSVIVVNTNHCDLLRQCLAALTASILPDNTEIIVVDNASKDGSCLMVEREYPNITLVRAENRRGPAANYNTGFSIARGNYLVVLNEDAEVSPLALKILYDHMQANPRVAIAGPKLTYPDGRPQYCCNRFPGLSSVCKRLVLHSFVNGAWVQNQYKEEIRDQAFAPDWIMATSLMIRRSALDETGCYDEQFEIYYEELELCRRLSSMGWTVAWLPDATVKHHHGISNFRLQSDRDIVFRLLLYQSRYRYFRKHHGQLYAGAIRVFEASLFFLFYLKTTMEALIPSRRAAAVLKVKLYRMLTRYALSGRGCPGLPQN